MVEEGMGHRVTHSVPFFYVGIQQTGDQVIHLLRDLLIGHQLHEQRFGRLDGDKGADVVEDVRHCGRGRGSGGVAGCG